MVYSASKAVITETTTSADIAETEHKPDGSSKKTHYTTTKHSCQKEDNPDTDETCITNDYP